MGGRDNPGLTSILVTDTGVEGSHMKIAMRSRKVRTGNETPRKQTRRRASFAITVMLLFLLLGGDVLGQTVEQNSSCVSVAVPCPSVPDSSAAMGACAGQGSSVAFHGCGTQDTQGNVIYGTTWRYRAASWHMCSLPGTSVGSSCVYSPSTCSETRNCVNTAAGEFPPVCEWVPVPGSTVLRNRCEPGGGGGPGPTTPASAAGAKIRLLDSGDATAGFGGPR